MRRWLWGVVVCGCSTDVKLGAEVNVEPAVSIDQPTSGTAFTTTDNIDLVGTIADGNGLDDIVSVQWSSSIDGLLADPEAAAPDSNGTSQISVALSEGVHAITLSATDTSGAEGIDGITITVEIASDGPTAEITSPPNLARFGIGEAIPLTGGAYDPNEDPDALAAIWTYSLEGTGPIETISDGSPSATGVTSAVLTPEVLGAFLVALEVTDADGNVGRDEILLEIFDPDDEDADGDGWSINQGDCDDNSEIVNPGAPEVCNSIDDDCNNIIDDKDIDSDAHIDINCVSYGGALPVDDCDDINSTVFPGASEQLDSLDNDCDGTIDDSLSEFDNDGDCFCSAASCVGSINPLCVAVSPGDCDDNNILLDPSDDDLDGSSTCTGDCDDLDPLRSGVDGDGDGFSTCTGDCNDSSAVLNPSDVDLDGASSCAGDCDDLDAAANLSDGDSDGTSSCSGDCDDEDPLMNLFDFDSDGFSTCTGDCNDFSGALNPVDADGDSFSTCQGDCNDAAPALDPADIDGDGQTSCAGDCDDHNASIDDLDRDGDGISTCAADCDDGDSDIYPGQADVPDDLFLDENCDGIDGDKLAAVFVAPGASNSGNCPFAAPCGSIQYAMDRADALGLQEVYIRAGTYSGAVSADFQTVDLYGGYDSGWSRDLYSSPGHLVNLVGGYWSGDSEYLAVRARTSSIGLHDLVVVAPSASGTEGGHGRSSYAIHAVGSTVYVERCEITQGNGISGTNGGAGASASSSPAASGTGGQNAESFNDTCDTGRRAGGLGAAGTCTNTSGGGGGQGGQMDTDCDSALGVEYCSPCDATAGLGGANATLWASGLYGQGGAGGSPDNAGLPGLPGRVINGSGGSGAAAGGLLLSDYWYGRAGGGGGYGEHGGGGGGGGGSGGSDSGTDDRGAGGGGGGAGGCRADPGGAAGSGGGSFGVFGVNSSIEVRLTSFQRGTGGSGGAGGAGGNGQPGGGGGSGGAGTSDTGPGGAGGAGGHGGHGGGGGGGAGGSVYAIYTYASSVTQVGNTFQGGAGGAGGAGGDGGPSWADGFNGGGGGNGALGAVGTCASPTGC